MIYESDSINIWVRYKVWKKCDNFFMDIYAKSRPYLCYIERNNEASSTYWEYQNVLG